MMIKKIIYYSAFHLLNVDSLIRNIFRDKDKKTEVIHCNKSNSTFFGYYNISPWNNSGDIIFNETKAKKKFDITKYPNQIYVQTKSKKTIKIGESKSWNWQQGSMAQWLNDDEVIFNNFVNNHYGCKIYNIKTGKSKQLDSPIYALSKTGKFSYTLNFHRLSVLRPDYGYFCIADKKINQNDKDGLLYFDIVNNSSELVLTFKDIIGFQKDNTMSNVVHRINHLDLSPNEKKIAFLHRWNKDGKGFHRLLVYDLVTKQMTKLVGNELASHFYWRNDDEILCYCQYNGEKGYHILNASGLEDKNYPIFTAILYQDGHPSLTSINKMWVTDTYPNKHKSIIKKLKRESVLYLFDDDFKKIFPIAYFAQLPKFKGSFRCDLHPRISPDGNFINFDSTHTGIRKSHILDIREKIKLLQ